MSQAVYREFQAANDSYVANFGDKGSLPLPPGRKVTVVTCMDARIDPAASLGIKEGDAHVIRNAGGSAREALRSVIISQQLLGTREIAVFHHTGCGMLTFASADLQAKLKAEYPHAAAEADKIDFLAFSQLEESVKQDVQFLKEHPLVLKDIAITGWIYDVETGKIKQVVEA